MSPPIDPRRLRLEGELPGPKGQRSQESHRKRKGKFIKGPLPRAWFIAAGKLPGKAVHIGLEVWFRVGLARSESVFISLTAISKAMGFSRPTAARGLASLEQAGLVTVERSPGRKPRVTVGGVDDADE